MSDIDFKGPWDAHVNLSAPENHKGFRVFRPDGSYIAEIYPLDEDGVEGWKIAELIAAAPDMLRVLRKIRDFDSAERLSDEIQVIEDLAAAITEKFEEARDE